MNNIYKKETHCCCFRRIIRVLKDERIRGVLLLRNTSASTNQNRLNTGFSEDAFCPNGEFGELFFNIFTIIYDKSKYGAD